MNFSMEMQSALKDPSLRGAFIADLQIINPYVCQVCGDSQYVFLFLAKAGPFTERPNGIAHWDGKHWWAGETKSFPCPECSGLKPEEQEDETVSKMRENWYQKD